MFFLVLVLLKTGRDADTRRCERGATDGGTVHWSWTSAGRAQVWSARAHPNGISPSRLHNRVRRVRGSAHFCAPGWLKAGQCLRLHRLTPCSVWLRLGFQKGISFESEEICEIIPATAVSFLPRETLSLLIGLHSFSSCYLLITVLITSHGESGGDGQGWMRPLSPQSRPSLSGHWGVIYWGHCLYRACSWSYILLEPSGTFIVGKTHLKKRKKDLSLGPFPVLRVNIKV